jgi:catechol 2,3-dioxygenase-like lactoylglutathione lyase family enzyme
LSWTGIENVLLTVGDLDEAIGFCTGSLGLPVAFRLDGSSNNSSKFASPNCDHPNHSHSCMTIGHWTNGPQARARSRHAEEGDDSAMTKARDLQAALAEAGNWVGQIPGVTAVGQGEHDGAPTVDIWVTDAPTPPRGLPAHLHGIPVRVLDTGGPIHAQNQPPD